MDGDQKTYELRNRSRSRSETPLTFNRIEGENEVSEHHYDLRSKSRDRSTTPGLEDVSSSRRSSSRSLPSSVVKARNKNMETITEQKDDTLTEIAVETLSKSPPKFEARSTKKVERRSERQRIKRQIFANGQSESKDDSSDTRSETNKRTSKMTLTSDYSSEEGDRDDVQNRIRSAYEFYKQQGEYWNKFPKTDYTYSQASTCRYEVAPGVMAIPNMSRRSLRSENSSQTSNSQSLSQSSKDSFSEDNTIMDFNQIGRTLSDPISEVKPYIRNYKNTGQSVIYNKNTVVIQGSSRREFILNSSNENDLNEKYETWADKLNYRSKNTEYRNINNVDSDTDLEDVNKSSSYRLKSIQKSNTTSRISAWFYAMLHFITFGLFKTKEFSTSHYYRCYEETKWSRIRRRFDMIFDQMYLLFVKIILFDSWLLSSVSKLRERAQGRRTKILWLLVPLFLTIGYFFTSYLLSAIPLINHQSLLVKFKRETPIVQSYTSEELKTNQELKNLVDLLISRVQYLETAKAEHSEHLANVTQAIEYLKHTGSNVWNKYDKKLLSLEEEIESQNNNREQCRAEELDVIRVELQTLKQLYAQLKSCCDMTSNVVNEDEIQKQADKIFVGYFGDSVSKDDVIRIFSIMNSKIQQEDLQKARGIVGTPGDEPENGTSTNLGIDEIRKIILGILKIYDADKTGLVDYALESAGGQIISTRCTQKYDIHTRAFKILGIPLFYESNNPRTVIQGNMLQPGMCWAFQDFPGYLLIKLRSPIYVTGFTLEHAPRENLPNGEIKSAPKKFNVWGLRAEDDLDPIHFGEYEFLDSENTLQYFAVQDKTITRAYEFVELRIHSNHGQLEYTCLYRFRVHGNLA